MSCLKLLKVYYLVTVQCKQYILFIYANIDIKLLTNLCPFLVTYHII